MHNSKTDSAAIRETLEHPVIDNDGHMIEIEPVLHGYLDEVAGPGMVDRYKSLMTNGRFWGWYNRSRDEVRERRIKRPPHWALAGKTVDRATAMVPRLWRERMDEFGIDFTIVYPDSGSAYAGDRRRRASPVSGARQQPHERRCLPGSRGPHHDRGDHPHAHTGRGHRRARIRGPSARHEGNDDGRAWCVVPLKRKPAGPWPHPSGSTRWAWTACTTMTRCGRNAAN